MAIDFYEMLRDRDGLRNMPHITISKRQTDKFVVYNKEKTRLDRMAGDYFQDEGYWRLIMWANPEYSLEFDIPRNKIIRIPFPLNDVLAEVSRQLMTKKER